MKKGFTLLELIIALGIGALVIVTVMISAQGAERSSRDGRRKADLNALAKGLEQWANNNSGKYPASFGDLTSGAFSTGGFYNFGDHRDPKTQSNYTSGGTAVPTSCTWSGPSVIYYNINSGGYGYEMGICLESNGVYRLNSRN